MARALLIASNEICYNPRLLKTADCLLERGFDVSVFNTIVGLAPADLYAEFVRSRPWQVEGPDISKRDLRSRAAWLALSVHSRAARVAWQSAGVRTAFPYVMNRGLAAFGRRHHAPFDLIVINLVDNLPFAALLKRRQGGRLLYDSQEFFTGQDFPGDSGRSRWVQEAEERFVRDADVVMATSQVMADRLKARYALTQPVVRVRNTPLSAPAVSQTDADGASPLRLVWHGFAVNYRGRGVDLILDAVARCKTTVVLTLQGRVDPAERATIESRASRLGIHDRVTFAPPAHPERIVESLVGHHVGVIAETGHDENQRLTSSNKLFEYIHAGLAVVAPDLPGLTETVLSEQVGLTYQAGDASALAECLDRLSGAASSLSAFRARARTAAPALTWRHDFAAAWTALAWPQPVRLAESA